MAFKYIHDLYEAVGKVENLDNSTACPDVMRGDSTRRVIRRLISEIDSLNNVLEIGPASGYITEIIDDELSLKADTALDVMDFSQSFLKAVKGKGYEIRDYIEGDITQEGMTWRPDCSYDIIFFQEVLEHLVSPFVALVNINRILVPGGYLYLTLPNAYFWQYQARILFRTSSIIRRKVILDTHISELAPPGVLKLVSMAGFDIVDLDFYASRFPFLRALTSRQMGILLKKNGAPEDRWKSLEKDILNHWKSKR